MEPKTGKMTHLQAEGKKADDPHADEIRDDITTDVRDQIILDVLAEQTRPQ